MDLTNFSITEILAKFGNAVSNLSVEAIHYLSSLGIQINVMMAKIITILISLILIYIFLKIITIPKKIVKWGIIFFLTLLIISIFASFFIIT